MDMDEILKKLDSEKYILLEMQELNNLLEQTESVRENDTMMSGYIRVLKYKDEFLIQEITKKDELALRLFPSQKEAEAFVDSRMVIYEQMWDGCGCKVNYYE